MFTFTLTLTLALTFAMTSASEPECFHLDGKLFGKHLHETLCVHRTDNYTEAATVFEENVVIVGGNPTQGNLELYTGELMDLPGDVCCPPNTFTTEIPCPVIHKQGSCCYEEGHVHVWDLPSQVGCVHSIETYDAYIPTFGEVLTWHTYNHTANTEVEIYAGVMGPYAPGCCTSWMYNLKCSDSCEFKPRCHDNSKQCENDCWLF